jgi:hypothetical protein
LIAPRIGEDTDSSQSISPPSPHNSQWHSTMPLPKAPDPVMVIAQEEPGTATYLRNAVKAEIFELQKTLTSFSFTPNAKDRLRNQSKATVGNPKAVLWFWQEGGVGKRRVERRERERNRNTVEFLDK